MGAHDIFAVTDDIRTAERSARWGLPGDVSMREERLPFTVKAVRSDEELSKAVYIRRSAYARHMPEFAKTLSAPEPLDRDECSVVLLAESKLDGSPIGSLRLQSNRQYKLCLERSVELPAWLQDCSLAEGTRLAITEGRAGRLVKAALIKAFYLYCLEWSIDWIVITARSPLDRQYEALLYRDVFPGGEFIPMQHIGNVPHRVMAFEVQSGEARWAEASHPLFDFMCRTSHPDIDVGSKQPWYLIAGLGQPTSHGEVRVRQ